MKPGEARGCVQVCCGERVIVNCVQVARSPWLRFRGLMGRERVPAKFGNGLLFPHCRSLHTCSMRFSLDIAFLDDEGRILKRCKALPPWRTATAPRPARHALEVTAGLLDELKEGDILQLRPCSDPSS